MSACWTRASKKTRQTKLLDGRDGHWVGHCAHQVSVAPVSRRRTTLLGPVLETYARSFSGPWWVKGIISPLVDTNRLLCNSFTNLPIW